MPYRQQPLAQVPGELVVVATYGAPHEAHLAVLHLEASGIRSHVENDLVVGMAPHLGSGSGGVRVLVGERDAAEAHRELEELRLSIQQEREQREPEGQKSPGKSWEPGMLLGLLLLVVVALLWQSGLLR